MAGKEKLESYSPKMVHAGDFPVVTDSGTVASGETIHERKNQGGNSRYRSGCIRTCSRKRRRGRRGSILPHRRIFR